MSIKDFILRGNFLRKLLPIFLSVLRNKIYSVYFTMQYINTWEGLMILGGNLLGAVFNTIQISSSHFFNVFAFFNDNVISIAQKVTSKKKELQGRKVRKT